MSRVLVVAPCLPPLTEIFGIIYLGFSNGNLARYLPTIHIIYLIWASLFPL